MRFRVACACAPVRVRPGACVCARARVRVSAHEIKPIKTRKPPDIAHASRGPFTQYPRRWLPGVLRNTFASFHYSEYQNENQLKALLGHSLNEGTLFRHYRAVQTVSGETITERMAHEFWALRPS